MDDGEEDPYPLPFSSPPREQGDFTPLQKQSLRNRALENPESWSPGMERWPSQEIHYLPSLVGELGKWAASLRQERAL